MVGGVVDLRSDTVTRPTAEMRRAMAAAEVGDDQAADHHHPRPALVCVENTHMPAGGVPYPVPALRALRQAAGPLPVHMDGARLFNAMVDRLAEDHERARRLAEAVAERWPGDCDPEGVRTNIVTWRHVDPPLLLDHLRGEGVLAGTIAPGVVRLVTHHDVDDEDIERVRKALAVAP